MTIRNQANTIETQARKLGYTVSVSYASTGTIYLTCGHELSQSDITVRVADHAECYCREDVSVDPQGVKVWQAIKVLADAINAESAYVKAAITREARQATERIAGHETFMRKIADQRTASVNTLSDFLAAQPIDVQRRYYELESRLSEIKETLSGNARKSALKRTRAAMKSIAGELYVY